MELFVQENFLQCADIKFFDKMTQREVADFLSSLHGKTIAFTGHRPSHLPWGVNEGCDICKKFKKKLDCLLEHCVNSGFDVFISGLALGFDTFACESVLKLKKKNPQIEMICAIPCKSQADIWCDADKQRYEKILTKSNPVYVSNEYYKGCFIRRNHFMVDKADLVVACFNGLSGGTKSTIEYAIKKQKKILIIKP